MYIYIVKKYVKAKNAHDALKKEKSVMAHDVWIEEQSQKNYIESQLETMKAFNFKKK